jgi:pimeloyl-ACP methyl ester carboxylesterase
VLVGATPIRYVQAGTGPDVVLVHGSPGSVEDWEPILARLSPRFRVTAFDRPGHGYSGGADRPHTPAEDAAVALDLIRALGLRDAVFVGHSYGGAIALDLAIRHPAEVRSYVLVGAKSYPPVGVEPIYRMVTLPVVGRGLATALTPLLGRSQIDAGVRASFGPNADAMPPDFVTQRQRRGPPQRRDPGRPARDPAAHGTLRAVRAARRAGRADRGGTMRRPERRSQAGLHRRPGGQPRAHEPPAAYRP